MLVIAEPSNYQEASHIVEWLLWLMNWLPSSVQVLGILFPYRLMKYISVREL
jgi:hypothetical protein